jgi:ribosomal protein S18 acetylase RimI-like enzyme
MSQHVGVPDAVTIRRAREPDTEGCVAVLGDLPDYFTPDTHDQVRAAVPEQGAWVAVDGDDIVGFVVAEQRYPTAAEITFAAVLRNRQNDGVGTALIERAMAELAAEGTQFVEVKTLDASAGYEPYVATRAFWERRGFVQIDCIDPLPGWQPGNPSAIYVAALLPTR